MSACAHSLWSLLPQQPPSAVFDSEGYFQCVGTCVLAVLCCPRSSLARRQGCCHPSSLSEQGTDLSCLSGHIPSGPRSHNSLPLAITVTKYQARRPRTQSASHKPRGKFKGDGCLLPPHPSLCAPRWDGGQPDLLLALSAVSRPGLVLDVTSALRLMFDTLQGLRAMFSNSSRSSSSSRHPTPNSTHPQHKHARRKTYLHLKAKHPGTCRPPPSSQCSQHSQLKA